MTNCHSGITYTKFLTKYRKVVLFQQIVSFFYLILLLKQYLAMQSNCHIPVTSIKPFMNKILMSVFYQSYVLQFSKYVLAKDTGSDIQLKHAFMNAIISSCLHRSTCNLGWKRKKGSNCYERKGQTELYLSHPSIDYVSLC